MIRAISNRPFSNIRVDGRVLWIRMRVFFLRENEGHRMYMVSLMDISDLEEQETG